MGKDGWKLVAAALARRQEQDTQASSPPEKVAAVIRIRVDENATR